MCLWSAQLTIAYGPTSKYRSDLGFQRHNMRTIMTEAPQLALASCLSKIWETGHVALRRTAHKTDEKRR